MHRGTRYAAALAGLVLTFTSVQMAYVLYGPKWDHTPVFYYVNTDNLNGLSETQVIDAVEAGALTWSSQSAANFQFQYGGTTTATANVNNGVNEVFFRDASGGSIATAYTWYVGGTIVDSDIVFWDAAYQFFTGSSGCSQGFYVEDIAAHEFGHSAGIGHNADLNEATMYPSVSYCSTSPRTLHADDIAAIEALYPPSGPQPPSAPSNLSATVSSSDPTGTIDLAWTDTSSNESHFTVERSTDGTVFSIVASPGAESTAWNDSGLESGTTYWYRVTAVNGQGSSAPSNVASAQTSAPPPSNPPDAPTGPSPSDGATGVDRNADLDWASAAGAEDYEVYFGTSDPPTYYGTTPSNAIALPRLSKGTTYFWRVEARNAVGNTSNVGVWQFTTAGKGGGGDGSTGGGGGGRGGGNGRGPK